MVLKFYLHDAATGDTGTLPATGATVSVFSPGAGVTISLTNKSMDATIGVLQASVAKTTLANTANQAVPIARFLSSPIAAQTIAAQAINVHWAGSDSSTNSNFNGSYCLAVWRPGTGAVVGTHADQAAISNANFNFTAEIARTTTTNSGATTSVTCQNGDILVLELWRDTLAQGMATAYTNTVFYDGTTEDSATTNAAYLLFTNDVSMSSGAATSLVIPPRANAGLTLRQRRPRA